MTVATTMLALSESFRDMTTGAQVLDSLEGLFHSLGATYFLVTGFPLPGRPIEPLIARINWGELRQDRPGGVALTTDDSMLHRAFASRRPVQWTLSASEIVTANSPLLAALSPARPVNVVASPVCAFLPYQGVVIAAGPALAVDTKLTLAIDHLCIEAFRRLIELGFVRPERPGELSARERRVVQLSATGKTANEIAEILEISQRTVHAHLQNASEKLAAHNKTHTVVEALRYGQISV